MIPQLTVDTFPLELFLCLQRTFWLAPNRTQRWFSIRHWGTARILLPWFSPAFPSSTRRGVWSHPWGDGCLWKEVTSESPHRTWPWLAFPIVEECAVTAPSGVWQSWWQAACRVTCRWEAVMSKGTLWTSTTTQKQQFKVPQLPS